MLTDMYAYFYGDKKSLPDSFDDYLDYRDAAVVSIDMHRGHLDDSPECPCPGPRGREVIEPTNEFHRACRAMGRPKCSSSGQTIARPRNIDTCVLA